MHKIHDEDEDEVDARRSASGYPKSIAHRLGWEMKFEPYGGTPIWQIYESDEDLKYNHTIHNDAEKKCQNQEDLNAKVNTVINIDR